MRSPTARPQPLRRQGARPESDRAEKRECVQHPAHHSGQAPLIIPRPPLAFPARHFSIVGKRLRQTHADACPERSGGPTKNALCASFVRPAAAKSTEREWRPIHPLSRATPAAPSAKRRFAQAEQSRLFYYRACLLFAPSRLRAFSLRKNHPPIGAIPAAPPRISRPGSKCGFLSFQKSSQKMRSRNIPGQKD